MGVTLVECINERHVTTASAMGLHAPLAASSAYGMATDAAARPDNNNMANERPSRKRKLLHAVKNEDIESGCNEDEDPTSDFDEQDENDVDDEPEHEDQVKPRKKRLRKRIKGRFQCSCTGCDKVYTKREHLMRHIRAVHPTESSDKPCQRPPKPFQCDLCQATFTYKHGLTRHHHRSHANVNKPYRCSICLLAFKKKSDLQAHSYVHTGIYPFECAQCDAKFLKKFQLTRHERTHMNQQSSQVQVFVCDVHGCDAMLFSREEHQEHHAQVHVKSSEMLIKQEPVELSTTKPVLPTQLMCQVCNRAFERKQNLRAHVRTHFEAIADRKAVVCPIVGCNKQYTKKSNMMAHYNACHDPIKSQRFVCPYAPACTGKFGYKKVLQTHMEKMHSAVQAEPPVRPHDLASRILGKNQMPIK